MSIGAPMPLEHMVVSRNRRRDAAGQGHALLSVVGACGLCLCSFSPAHAYLDAGTGSILLQVIIGAVAAGMAALAGLRGRISAVLSHLKRKGATATNVSNEPGEQ